MQKINVVTKNGDESRVNKSELQYLLVTQQVMFFERADGWAVIGRDKVRGQKTLYPKKNRREHEVYAYACWN